MRAEHLRPRGASIVELMVAMVIALLVGLAATATAIFFTASQRQAVGTSSTFSSAAMILSAIKEEVAQAGLGFFDGNFLCNRLNLSIGERDLSQAVFSPMQVTRDGASDRIDIFYGSEIAGATNVPLSASSDLGSAQVASYMPAGVGQAVLLTPLRASATPCTVRSVTGTSADGRTFVFGDSGIHNQASGVAFPVVYSGDNSRLGVLGTLRWNRYRLDGQNLLFEQPLLERSAVLVRNVMALRVQYGVASVGNSALTEWLDPVDTWAALDTTKIARVKAVRIGLVMRSPQREKALADGSCEASSELPQLFGQAVSLPADDWNCYRYRTAMVVVPMRNVVMGTGVLQ